MRAVAIGILAVLCGGCAAPAYDLVSRDPESPWLVGQRHVRTESSRSTVTASYDRTFLGDLIFEVEVVNQSGAPLVVDPRQFSFTLASSSNDVPRSLRRRFNAENPEKVRARLDRAASGQVGFGEAALGFVGFVGAVIVVAAAVSAGVLAETPSTDECESTSIVSVQQAASTQQNLIAEHRRSCQHALTGLLQRTELAPGESARGEIWFPAWPLRRVVGSGATTETGSGITATPPRAPSDHALTLRTPEALGGQEIDYSISAW